MYCIITLHDLRKNILILFYACIVCVSFCGPVHMSSPLLYLWCCSWSWGFLHWWWWFHTVCNHMTDRCYCWQGDSPCSPASLTCTAAWIVKHPNILDTGIWQNTVNIRPLNTMKWNLYLCSFYRLGTITSSILTKWNQLRHTWNKRVHQIRHMTDIWCLTKPELPGVARSLSGDIDADALRHTLRCTGCLKLNTSYILLSSQQGPGMV